MFNRISYNFIILKVVKLDILLYLYTQVIVSPIKSITYLTKYSTIINKK